MPADTSWTLDPGVLSATVIAGAAYGHRWREVRRSEGPRAAPVWRLACFGAALASVIAALVSPLDALADQLFSMHMVQHVLLLDVGPILGILAFNRVLLRPLTRRVTELERAAGWLAHPVFAVALYVTTIWAWHIPGAYDAALHHSLLHAFEHITFVVAGSAYWWHLLGPIRSRLRLDGMGPVAYMASTKVLVGVLGIGLAFAPKPLYDYYVHHARVWSLSAGDDQSIAGLIMAVEQSIVMGTALAWLFMRMLTESEREQQRRERLELVP